LSKRRPEGKLSALTRVLDGASDGSVGHGSVTIKIQRHINDVGSFHRAAKLGSLAGTSPNGPATSLVVRRPPRSHALQGSSFSARRGRLQPPEAIYLLIAVSGSCQTSFIFGFLLERRRGLQPLPALDVGRQLVRYENPIVGVQRFGKLDRHIVVRR
jgi:hypothetical protein